MLIQTARTSALLCVAAALAAGRATVVAPTSPAELSGGRPGYVIGYLTPAQLPDTGALLPPPPAAGSAAFAADEDAYRSTRRLRDTPRWTLAAKDALLARGYAYGQSRIVCGVHWQSDVEAGRVVGASTVSRLHADPVFAAQMAGARKEIAAARAAGLKSPLDCAAEAQALAGGR